MTVRFCEECDFEPDIQFAGATYNLGVDFTPELLKKLTSFRFRSSKSLKDLTA